MTITRPRIPHSDNFEEDPTRELQGPEGNYHIVVTLRLPVYDRPSKLQNTLADLLRDIHVKNNPSASVDFWHWESSTRNYPFDDPQEPEQENNPDGDSTPEPEKENDGPQEPEPSEDSCNDRAGQAPV